MLSWFLSQFHIAGCRTKSRLWSGGARGRGVKVSWHAHRSWQEKQRWGTVLTRLDLRRVLSFRPEKRTDKLHAPLGFILSSFRICIDCVLSTDLQKKKKTVDKGQ